MKLTHLKDGQQIPINIAAHKLFGADRAEVIHLCFKPGETLAKHTNPFDVVFYVLEGTGNLEVDDQTLTAGSDTLIEVSAPEQRGWTNTGSGDLRVLVIKLL
ncbi:MAG: cupin domain-containing protein [Syntrophotaleaceae bacterium]